MRLRNGQAVDIPEIEEADLRRWPPVSESTPISIMDREGAVQAIARLTEASLQPVKVLAQL